MTKSDFIRSMGKRPAREVVALGKKKGMKLSERYVYVVRSSDRSKKFRRTVQKNGKTGLVAETDFRHAVAELGLRRSHQILGEIEKAFEGA